MGKAFGRCMRTMGGRKRIVDVNVSKLGEFGGEFRVVLFLAGVKARIFRAAARPRFSSRQRQRVPLRRYNHRRRRRAVRDGAAIRRQRGAANSRYLVRPFGLPKCASRITLPFLLVNSRTVGRIRSMRVVSVTLPPSMGTLRSTRTKIRLPLTGTSSRVLKAFIPTSCIAISCQSWAKVGPAGHFTCAPGLSLVLDQISLPIATAVSAIRWEKPHSLSYQDRMRTKLPPKTLVWSRWKIEE